MPAKSEKQRRLFAAALHGASFPKARTLREAMSPQTLREFTHVKAEKPKRRGK